MYLHPTATITFPPYVTSLDVAWSTSTGWTRTVQTTTLTIPPVTTTRIPFWEYTLSGSDTTTKDTTTFYPTRSILPPPFVITDDPNPLSEPSARPPSVTITWAHDIATCKNTSDSLTLRTQKINFHPRLYQYQRTPEIQRSLTNTMALSLASAAMVVGVSQATA